MGQLSIQRRYSIVTFKPFLTPNIQYYEILIMQPQASLVTLLLFSFYLSSSHIFTVTSTSDSASSMDLRLVLRGMNITLDRKTRPKPHLQVYWFWNSGCEDQQSVILTSSPHDSDECWIWESLIWVDLYSAGQMVYYLRSLLLSSIDNLHWLPVRLG